MTELPTQYMAAEPANAESVSEHVLNPELVQARLRVQTIQRFRALSNKISTIRDLQQWKEARVKLDELALAEYGKVWEVLKNPPIEVVPLAIGGKTKDELKRALTMNRYRIESYAEGMLDSPDFTTMPQSEPAILICLTVGDLGFSFIPTTDEIFARAEEFGLELCPAEVGPWYRLHTPEQPAVDYVYIGMTPIEDTDGDPDVFLVAHDNDRRRLSCDLARPNTEWAPDSQFLFRLPLLHPEPVEVTHE